VDVTTGVVGKIATSNSAVISIWALDVDLNTTCNSITVGFVADINPGAVYGGVVARVGKIGGLRIADISGASIVVITNRTDVLV